MQIDLLCTESSLSSLLKIRVYYYVFKFSRIHLFAKTKYIDDVDVEILYQMSLVELIVIFDIFKEFAYAQISWFLFIFFSLATIYTFGRGIGRYYF